MNNRLKRTVATTSVICICGLTGIICLSNRDEEISIVKEDESAVSAEPYDASSTEDSINAESSKNEAGDSSDLPENQNEQSDNRPTGKIVVYVCGEVRNPSVVELPEGSRVYEAIAEAGGMTPEADDDYVNLAGELTDGVKLYIPSEDEVQSLSDKDSVMTFDTSILEESSESSKNTEVNINTASKEELMTLPGVGESKAEAIIKYREQNGAFDIIDDIMCISGIKEGLFNKIKDRIRV